MRIYHAADSDPMILDSAAGMSRVHDQLSAFVESGRGMLTIAADVSGSPEPYERFLGALEIELADGPIVASITEHGHLRITGSSQNLVAYVAHFRFSPNEHSSHHHPDNLDVPGFIAPNSMRTIIEVDTERIQEIGGES